jgi:UDP-glucose 4-epimerase
VRTLVTGGAGFIGSHLVERLLAEGHEVDAVDDLSAGSLANLAAARGQRGFRFQHVDIRSPELTELFIRRRPQVVFHLAAQVGARVSVQRPLLDADVNVLGSLNVLEAARASHSAKIVFASSGAALYGDPDPGDLPVRESQPRRPLSPYGVSKAAVGDYLATYRDLHELEYTALALANVYGPRQDPAGESGAVAVFGANLLSGRPCTIFGDGRQSRDYVYVDDVVDAFARATEKGGGLLLNVGTGIETAVNDLHALMAETLGIAAPVQRLPGRPGDVARIALDSGKAAIHLGWKPWTSLEEGVAVLLQWLVDNPARLDSAGPS